MKISQGDKEMIELIAVGVADRFRQYTEDTDGLADYLYAYSLPCLGRKFKRFVLDNKMRDWLIKFMRHWAVGRLVELGKLHGSARTTEEHGAWYGDGLYSIPTKRGTM